MIKGTTYDAFGSVRAAFQGFNLLLQLAAIALTVISVESGFDWWYYVHLFSLQAVLFPAAILGFLVPVCLPICLYVYGSVKKHASLLTTSFAIARAELLGLLTSFFYKALTGRAHPELFAQPLVDISRQFHFGVLDGGVFWGWPSSHTAVAFAMAACVWKLFPENKYIRWIAGAYALYIGIGVSATIHWFSDFAAGALIGTAVGRATGKTFVLARTSLSAHQGSNLGPFA